MKYTELQKIRYQNKGKEAFDTEFNKRFDGYGTIKTGLKIHPFGQDVRITTKQYTLFVVNNQELMMLQERIMDKAVEINNLLNNIPDVAKNSFLRGVLINEIQSTNEIEGVHSSRKEISRAWYDMEQNQNKNTRFLGILKLYSYLSKGDFEKISDIKEIREIYDKLVSDEVDASNILDGEYFRKGSVEVTQGERVIHRGNPNESSIISDLIQYIKFINDSNIPFLIKAMLGHYFFEYIHPFYDGNGRTGRYITCRYLSEKLDILTALSFSHIINEQKDVYYKAFKTTSAEYNMGEGTMFVYELLKIVLKGQESLISNLKKSEELMDKAYFYTRSTLRDTDNIIHDVFFLICQASLFRDELTDDEIASLLGTHRVTVNKRLKTLFQKGLIQQVKKRPSIHTLTNETIQAVNNQILP